MEIASQYSNPKALQRNFHIIFQSDFICSLSITLAEIRSAIEFFIANWTALKSHDPNVIIGSSLLAGMYHKRSHSPKKTYRIIKRFETSIVALKSCIYDAFKARGIHLNYCLNELPDLIENKWESLTEN